MAPKHNVNVIIPRAGRLPSDVAALLSSAVLSLSPSAHDDRILRTDRIQALIDSARTAR